MSRHRNLPALRTPREGTKLRRLYDLLLTGAWINAQDTVGGTYAGSALEDLRSYYNCEIEGRQCRGSRMKGRWDGDRFIPLERLDENVGGAA